MSLFDPFRAELSDGEIIASVPGLLDALKRRPMVDEAKAEKNYFRGRRPSTQDKDAYRLSVLTVNKPTSLSVWANRSQGSPQALEHACKRLIERGLMTVYSVNQAKHTMNRKRLFVRLV